MDKFSEPKRADRSQAGSMLLEVLVAVVLLSVMGLGLAQSAVMSTRVRAVNVRNSVATQIAAATLEKYAALNPSTVPVVSNQSSEIVKDGIQFTQIVNIVANSDGSKTVSASVAATSSLGGSADLSVQLMAWGAQ